MQGVIVFDLTKEELAAFANRANAELGEEDGEFEISYLGYLVTIYCQKGAALKAKIEFSGRRIYRKLAMEESSKQVHRAIALGFLIFEYFPSLLSCPL